MKYTSQELAFILYNNRSIQGVVKNFMAPFSFDYERISKIDEQLEWCQNMAGRGESTVDIPLEELLLDVPDLTVTPEDLGSVPAGVMCETERRWLSERGITKKLIDRWGMFSASSVQPEFYDALGLTCHPVLKNLLLDGLDEGCVCIPLYRDGTLVNCTSRRISDVGKLKYVQAVPDVDVWGLGDITGKHVFIAEGLFDMMALRENGVVACSVSGAMWSSIQLYKLLCEKPGRVTIFADKDRTGLYSAWVLRKFLAMNGIHTNIMISTFCKDAAEHFFVEGFGWDFVECIDVKRDDFLTMPEQSFNFIKYLKERKF